jgi:hypothetical protein
LAAPLPAQSWEKTEFVQRRAGQYLASLGRKHPSCARVAVPKLVPLLEHTNFSTRFSAGMALSSFGSNAAPAIPVIERLISDNPEMVHDIMLRILERCGPEAKRVIPTLRSAAIGDRILSIQCARTLWVLDTSQADFVRPIALRFIGSTRSWHSDRVGGSALEHG